MKYKLLLTSVALSAFAMSAQAAISTNNGVGATANTNSELFFSAYDAITEKGYTFDLTTTLALNDIVGSADLNPTGTTDGVANNTVMLSRIPSYIGTGVFLDMALTDFGSQFTSTSNVVWNLAAFDGSGRNRLLTTQTIGGANVATTDGNVREGVNSLITYVAAANAVVGMGTGALNDSFVNSTLADGGGYAGTYGKNWSNLVADTTNAMGEKSNLFFYAETTNGSTPAETPLFAQLGLTARTYQLTPGGEWRLALEGLPAVTPPGGDPVAAIPEPESYAMMLAGLALMGGVARRRNNKA